ncbi:BTAD domain-containing putative transcriptional regulator [Pseudosulfitobacter sp. SM2401]|uniref:AfsR/SARP family transcriptional regulator n=1 Tax=Pseudosulfitobacter sp. SM2401 TaxID=3350098 RepID=UPI0036F3BAE3
MPNYEEIGRFLAALKLKKARALAMYLLLAPGRERRNELIIDLLWQESKSGKSYASLRQTVRHLRQTSDAADTLPLLTGNGCISTDLPREWCLLSDLATGLQNQTQFVKASRTITSFLEHLDLLIGISDTFDGWLAITRDRAISKFRATLEHAVETGTGDGALSAAEFLIDIDPNNEIGTRWLMLHHWRAQSAKRAIELYNRLYVALDEEFDQEPETATMELLAAIKLDPEGARASNPAKPARQKVTLVVEEVENLRLSRRDASFQSVLVSDLRSVLSRFREWQVVGSKPMGNDFLSIHLKLFSIDGKYRLSVEVIHTERRELLWSELIDDPHNDWSGKVRLLVLNIGNALRVVVADRQSVDNRAALYDRWLQSLALKGTWTKTDEEKAVVLLRGITQEVPDFGPAHAELAGIYNIRHVLRPGTFQANHLKDMALNHALEAVSADAMDTRAHRVLAWCYCHKSEFDLAEFHFEQSLLLNPQNAHTIASSALGFAFCDNAARTKEMITDLSRLPQAMEPFHQIYLAAAGYLVGAYEDTVRYCVGGDGLMSTVGGWHSAALIKLGDTDAANCRFGDYFKEISATWYGDHAATPRSVIDWYVSCFPLRNEAVREDLRQTLNQIAFQGQSIAHFGDIDADRTVESCNR